MRVGYGISGTNILSIGRGVSVGGGGGWRGPYDAVPSITAAYGVRRLLFSYAGPILRLRRDSDNTEQDIGYVANGDLDTAALAPWLGEANGYITTWYDQSGNGNHATQATAASQPLYVASGQNGRPVLRFDGTDDALLFTNPLTGNSDISVLATMDWRKGDPVFQLGSSVDGNTGVALRRSGSAGFYWGANTFYVAAGLTVSIGPCIVTCWRDADVGWDAWLNGAAFGSGEVGNARTRTTATNLSSNGSIGLVNGIYGGLDIGEFVIANAAWPTAQRQAAEQAANNYWQVY